MKLWLHFAVPTLLCIGTISQALAQSEQTQTLTQCIESALQNNSNYKNAQFQVKQAGANVKSSYSTVLPRITLSLSSGQSVNSRSIPLFDSSGTPIIDPATGEQLYDRQVTTQPKTSFNNHSATISASQNLFDFGKNWNTIKQARASFHAISKNLEAARQNVYVTVNQRYLELLKAQKLKQEYALAVERSKEQLNRTQSMFEIGSVAQVDVYRQEVILGTDEINLVMQKNIVAIAEGNLNVVMGRDPETAISIADMDISEYQPDFTLENAVEVAGKNNPDLSRFEYDMKSAEYGKKIAKTAFLPSIYASGFYSRDNEKFNKVYGEFAQNYFYRVGLNLDLNILNGMSDIAEVSRQNANYSMAKENWTDAKRQTRLNVKQAYLNLNAYNEISKINHRNLRAAEEEYRLAQERYRVGAGTQLEVTDAQVSLTRARVNLIRAKYDALISKAQLEAAMGTTGKD